MTSSALHITIQLKLRPQWMRLDPEIFPLDEVDTAMERAHLTGGAVYCWKVTGEENWLEHGISTSDVLCLAILPRNLPAYIDMLRDR